MSEDNIIAIISNTEIKDFFGCNNHEFNINHIFNSGSTLLTAAVKTLNLSEVTNLVVKGANVNQREEGGATPLLLAICLNKLNIVEFLLKYNADVNKGDSYDTPLTLAVRKGHIKIVKCLVDKNATVNVVTVEGISPIFWSIKEEKVEILKLLISRGIPKDIKNDSGETPLIAAVKNRASKEILQCLLTNGAEISVTALVWAAAKGHQHVIEVLIDNGADANLIDPDGNTLLATAARYRQFEIVKFLTDLGVSVCKVGPKGKTPLLWAVQNEDLDLIEWLVRHGAFYIIKDVFLEAIKTKNLEIVKFLYDTNSDTSPNNINLTTSLDKALEVGTFDIAKFLLDCGAILASLGVKETTYLLGFIEKKNHEMVDLFIERGANINISHTISGHTPLTKAVTIEDFKITEKLVLHNADINLRNGHRFTPLAVAANGQNFQLFEYLVRSGANLDNDPSRHINPNLLHYYQTAKEKILKEQQLLYLQSVSNQEAAEVEEEEVKEEEVEEEKVEEHVDDVACTEEAVKEKSLAERHYYVIEFD